jgi:hypothetical protein
MSIEFIGLPGAGKSSICGWLSKSLTAAPAPTSVRIFCAADTENRAKLMASKLLRAALFVVVHPRTAAAFIALVRSSGQSSRRDGISKTLNLFSEIGREKWHRGSLSIYEQGVVQAIWSVAIGAGAPDVVSLLRVASPYLPHCVVHVEADHGDIHRSLESRTSGRSRFDRLPPEYREQFLHKGDALFQTILAEWKRLGPEYSYVQVRNSGDADPNVLASGLLGTLEIGGVTAESGR